MHEVPTITPEASSVLAPKLKKDFPRAFQNIIFWKRRAWMFFWTKFNENCFMNKDLKEIYVNKVVLAALLCKTKDMGYFNHVKKGRELWLV